MEMTTLGRTGLQASVAGLGCGGRSRLGLGTGGTRAEAIRVVHRALDLGVNLVDTAAIYGTEEVVGQAIADRRDGVVVSTKVIPEDNGEFLSAAGLRAALDSSLRRLGTDHVDIFFLHGVGVRHLDHCRTELAPELERMKSAGKIRAAAMSEAFGSDTSHEAFRAALDAEDRWFDIAMVGFNILNPSARTELFVRTQTLGIGVLAMFAVRNSLSNRATTEQAVAELIKHGVVDPAVVPTSDPLAFLVHSGGAPSVVDAAYRFVRHEPGCDVVLTGTGSVTHLDENIASITAPPLPAADLARLEEMFGQVDSVSGN